MSAYLPSGLSVLVVLSCLLVLCQSAPMNPTEPCESTQPGSLLDATNALVSNEILKLTMEELMAGQDSLNGEVQLNLLYYVQDHCIYNTFARLYVYLILNT